MFDLDLSTVEHHPALNDIVDVLGNRTQNVDKGFFRAEVAYFLGKIASCMRARIVTKDRGEVPVNIYTLALATSGFGKGHSVSIVENEFLKGFQNRFMEETFFVKAEEHMWQLATNRAIRNGTEQDEEKEKLDREFRSTGAYPFTFDSGTAPAVKQLRQKLLLANGGAINFQMDEIGSNLVNNTEILNLYLELYDKGRVKQKLTKNTAESQRTEEVDGETPANMLLFGTPSKLLDGGLTEDQFYDFLETGYARRCIFGYGQHYRPQDTLTPAEIYARLIQPSNTALTDKWAYHFEELAAPEKFGWRMEVEDDVAIQLIAYKTHCETISDTYAEHEDIKKAELSHRYFKALKLAGVYAFIDESSIVTMDHLHSAIKLVEESGEAFQLILTREKAYVKLAKYIASVEGEVTHADLDEKLPYYKKTQAGRNEQLALATAWGYKQHIIIKKSFVDGIEFFKGESLKETDLNEIIVSYSNHWAYNYLNERVPFDQLFNLTQATDMHWCNHHLAKGHRAEENVINGFNTIVIDADGGISLDMAHDLLKDYKFMTYTTKSHTPQQNRFRLIMPINYILTLDTAEYKEFMNGILKWLPFESDESANQRAKKWEAFDGGTYHYNDGALFDALDFIPKTSRNESHRQQGQALESLDNMERWFAQRMVEGSRNNHMIRYAMALKDSGMGFLDVSNQIKSFNRKLSNPLPEDELDTTVLRSVASKYSNLLP
ncbi:DNA primase [Agrobacterium phage OLIVR2]|uniref:DNA primase n=1 Tax=Agrobacterium phage OLIVR1 TaxID=2723769 RepID=A0A858MR70_9CAUD|nr:primase C-terminal domain-containing protein [Xanthomonas campestris]YP_010107111.1 DNA primase [Agrobacterium phage OLIVR1]QIW87380.1 DNA primase [Agrobacterium phage OLIVR2]QIW87487.1 DNA primase [Agrobacterium phage OLIVR3]MCF8861657.1 primase C-terminal domain-containing protein [Xanthomonas campestris pv. campestris]QIW87272.1 DNA primase [Agrobacterium phage OLIVR1]